MLDGIHGNRNTVTKLCICLNTRTCSIESTKQALRIQRFTAAQHPCHKDAADMMVQIALAIT